MKKTTRKIITKGYVQRVKDILRCVGHVEPFYFHFRVNVLVDGFTNVEPKSSSVSRTDLEVGVRSNTYRVKEQVQAWPHTPRKFDIEVNVEFKIGSVDSPFLFAGADSQV